LVPLVPVTLMDTTLLTIGGVDLGIGHFRLAVHGLNGHLGSRPVADVMLELLPEQLIPYTTPPPTAPPRRAQQRASAVILSPMRFLFHWASSPAPVPAGPADCGWMGFLRRCSVVLPPWERTR
jgi:hypothetical protein